MEPGDSLPHSQGLSINPYPEPNKPNFSYLKDPFYRNIVPPSTDLPEGLCPAGLPVKILKAHLTYSIRLHDLPISIF